MSLIRMPSADWWKIERNAHVITQGSLVTAAASMLPETWVGPDERRRALETGEIVQYLSIGSMVSGGAELQAAADLDALLDAIAPVALKDRLDDLRAAVKTNDSISAETRPKALHAIAYLQQLLG